MCFLAALPWVTVAALAKGTSHAENVAAGQLAVPAVRL